MEFNMATLTTESICNDSLTSTPFDDGSNNSLGRGEHYSNSTTNLSQVFNEDFTLLLSHYPEVVSKETFQMFALVVNVFCDGLVSVLGMAANAVNMGVFLRMGIWDDSNSMGLFALALSDFFYLLSLSGVSFCWATQVLDLQGLRWDPVSFEYVAFSRSLTVFSDITCWITAFLAIERCLCVFIPIKFKLWISPPRTLLILTAIFVISILSQSYLYHVVKLVWVFDPAINNTKIYAVFNDDHNTAAGIAHLINAVILRVICVIAMIICTNVTAYKVRQSVEWQQINAFKTISSGSSGQTTQAVSILNIREIGGNDAVKEQTQQREHGKHLQLPQEQTLAQQMPQVNSNNVMEVAERERQSKKNDQGDNSNRAATLSSIEAPQQRQEQQQQHQGDNSNKAALSRTVTPQQRQEQQQQHQGDNSNKAALSRTVTPQQKLEQQQQHQGDNSNKAALSRTVTPQQKLQQQQQHYYQQQHQKILQISSKKLRMIKIITQICVIYIACYAPEIFVALVSLFMPGLEYGGRYHRLYSIFYYTSFFLGALNASINIFIYFVLSSKYRTELANWLGRCRKHNRD